MTRHATKNTPPLARRVPGQQLALSLHEKLIVDLFAGGGGMSCAMEMAWGRCPDIAVNHNDDALSMHRVNHPHTRHLVADVFEVDPRTVTRGQPVGWLHGSPDCTHHSQASGGQPRSKKIRGLAWVLISWAGQVRPDVISMENVKQMLKWGPLIAKRDPKTGRCLKRSVDDAGKAVWLVAEPGERVRVQDQYLIPDPAREGRTWLRFTEMLQQLGYQLDWRVLCAADLGGHTTRERLFMIARRDGQPIVWAEQSHFKHPTGRQQQHKAAAECIDFTLPCQSIFGRKRALADATLRRIARGVMKFVMNNAEPFIVNMAHGGKLEPVSQPLSTIATEKGGCRALAAPVLVQAGHGEGKAGGKRWSYGCNDIAGPVGTVTASGGGHALATAYLMQANGGFNTTPGHSLGEPMSTVTNTGSQQQLVTAFLAHFRGNCDAKPLEEPLHTVSAAGQHHGVVECVLSPEQESGAMQVAAFLIRYYGEGGQLADLHEPMPTITTRDRMALVTVRIRGTPYVIVDIGLRMLEPRELFRAQDFPEDYIIDRGHDGRVFSKSTQVRMVGNSVNPMMAVGFLRANAPWLAVDTQEAA